MTDELWDENFNITEKHAHTERCGYDIFEEVTISARSEVRSNLLFS